MESNLEKYDRICEYMQTIKRIFTDKISELDCFSSMLQENEVLVENYIIYDILDLMKSNLKVICCIEKDIGQKLSNGEELRNNIALLSSIYTIQDLLDYLFKIFKISTEKVKDLREDIRKVRNETVGHPICYGPKYAQNILTSTIVWYNLSDNIIYDNISYLYRKDGKLEEQVKKDYDVLKVISEHFDFMLKSFEIVVRRIIEIFEINIKKIWFPIIDACFDKRYDVIVKIGFKGNNAFLSKYFTHNIIMALTDKLVLHIISYSHLKEYRLKLYEIIFFILGLVYEEESGFLYELKELNSLVGRESDVIEKLEERKNTNIDFLSRLNILFAYHKKMEDIEVLKDFLPKDFFEILENCKNRDDKAFDSLTYNYLYSKIVEHRYYEDLEYLKKMYSFDNTILSYFEKLEKFWFVGEDYWGDNEDGYCEYHINRFYLDWLLRYIENILE